MQRNIT